MNEKYVNQYDGFFHEDKVLGYTSEEHSSPEQEMINFWPHGGDLEQ